MPKVDGFLGRPPQHVYWIGIDPGVDGALVTVNGSGAVDLLKMPDDLQTVRDWLRRHRVSADGAGDTVLKIVLELQKPRPTFVPKMKSSVILKSTCMLYGSFWALKGVLVGLDLPFVEVDPQRWQHFLGMFKLAKEPDHKWKGRLADLARREFPDCKVTQKTADAYLLARYARETMP
jgi:hypothetical protein